MEEKTMRQKILKEISSWPFELLVYAFRSEGCSTIAELVTEINKAYVWPEDLKHLRYDFEYAMNESNK